MLLDVLNEKLRKSSLKVDFESKSESSPVQSSPVQSSPVQSKYYNMPQKT